MTDTELNEAVARKLGYFYSGEHVWIKEGKDEVPRLLPDYCHSISAAWEIVDFVKDKYFTLERGVLGDGCNASFNWAEDEQTDLVVLETADSAPRAICLAFLKLP